MTKGQDQDAGHESIFSANPSSPIERLHLFPFVDSQHIRHIGGVDTENLCPECQNEWKLYSVGLRLLRQE